MKKYMGYQIKVLNKTWSVYFLTQKQFHTKYGSGILAMCETDDREVYYRRDQFTSETIIHELFHAYMQEYCAHTLDLNIDQVEELAADIFSKDGQDILDQSKELINAFNILKRRPRRKV